MEQRWTAARAAGVDATRSWRELIALSQPGAWAHTAIPYLVGAYEAERAITPALVIGAAYFLGPYNLLLHGLDGLERGPAGRATATRFAIAVTNLPLLVVLVALGGAALGVALLFAVGAALAYSVPPLRTRRRPALAAPTHALVLVLPAVCGLLSAGGQVGNLPWPALGAFFAWAIASHLLGAIPGANAIRAAGTAWIAGELGPRALAGLAFIGYVATTAIAASIGGLAILAAAGLALYLLLPTTVLSAPLDQSATKAAAGQAWRDFIGLDILVGLWLLLLAASHWGIIVASPFDIVLVATTIAIGYALANVLAIRLATRRRGPRRAKDDIEIPSLAIIVPFGNDAERLPAALRPLLYQTYADSWVVAVDEGATDGSADLAASILSVDGAEVYGEVITPPPTPEGWTDRAWARHVGAGAATTDLLLFMDPETELSPVTVRVLVEQMLLGDDDLLSGLTRFRMPTWDERAAVPGLPMLLFGFAPMWWSALTRGRPPALAFAFGRLMLVRRDAYQAAGGHAAGGTRASPLNPLENLHLARILARAGERIGTIHMADLAATRRGDGLADMVGTWRRVAAAGARAASMAGVIAAIVVQALAYAAPLVLPVVALASGASPEIIGASLIPLVLLLLMRIALVVTQRQHPGTILWHPVTIAVALIGQVLGLVDHVAGRHRDDPSGPVASPPSNTATT